MSFTWTREKKSMAVAITTSKIKDLSDKILYLNEDTYERKAEDSKKVKPVTKDDISEVLYSRVANRTIVVNDIYEAFKKGIEYKSDNERAMRAYEEIKRKQKRELNEYKIELPMGSEFEFLPLMKQDLKNGNLRQSLFISGAPNSGKSYFCKNYLLLYNEMYPKNKVFFISQQDLQKDESLADVKKFMTQISIDELMDSENPITWESFTESPCLVMIDDYDGLERKAEKRGMKSQFEVVLNLAHNILANARKFGTSCIITSHELNSKDGSTSKLIKNVDYFIVFTRGILKHNLEYFCLKYLGLSKDIIEEMRKSPSRWYAIRRLSPFFVLSQYDARILE